MWLQEAVCLGENGCMNAEGLEYAGFRVGLLRLSFQREELITLSQEPC